MPVSSSPLIREYKTLRLELPATLTSLSMAEWQKDLKKNIEGEAIIIDSTTTPFAFLLAFPIIYLECPEAVLETPRGEFLLLFRNFDQPEKSSLKINEIFWEKIQELREKKPAIWSIANPTPSFSSELEYFLESDNEYDFPDLFAKLENFILSLDTAHEITLSGEAPLLPFVGALLLTWPVANKIYYQKGDDVFISIK